jgi:hypothetical protein
LHKAAQEAAAKAQAAQQRRSAASTQTLPELAA